MKFVAAHFIELDSSSNLSTHPPVILHAGLAGVAESTVSLSER